MHEWRAAKEGRGKKGETKGGRNVSCGLVKVQGSRSAMGVEEEEEGEAVTAGRSSSRAARWARARTRANGGEGEGEGETGGDGAKKRPLCSDGSN